MSPDEFQEAWRAEASRTRVTIDAEALHNHVRVARQDFRTSILWRDFREVGIAIVMVPLWFYLGFRAALPWTWYLTVPALIWVAGFIVADRWRCKQRSGKPGDTVVDSVKDSLAQVSHQIWLLRNVVWWYLLPFLLSISAFFIQVSLQGAGDWTEALVGSALMVGGLLAVYSCVYALNQFAVRKHLEPRRLELLSLLESLASDSRESSGSDFPILLGAGRTRCSARRALVGNIFAVLILVVGVPAMLVLAPNLDRLFGSDRGDFPKRAPFTDVRWGDRIPEVDVEGERYFLYAIDGLFVDQIIDYCERNYAQKWQKRFAEDLVEVLAGMGHKTGETVELGLISKPEPATMKITAVDGRFAVKSDEAQEHQRGDAGARPAFTVERWRNGIPTVAVEGKSYLLTAVEGISVADIAAYGSEQHPDAWQQRFADDLAGLLAGMGHETGETISFEGFSMAEQVTKEVPMTAANRNAVRRALQERESVHEVLDQGEEAMKEGAINQEKGGRDAPLVETLESIRASYKLPALAAFALHGSGIVEQATVGTRSLDDSTPVDSSAQWHLGSNTKAMTATVAGVLVEEGVMRWDSTIGEILGAAVPGLHVAHHDTTLAQLLHHTAGITPNIRWFSAPKDRISCASEILAKPPAKKPGAYTYSNAGYVVAGAMMEEVTGKAWEELMEEKLFGPLGMIHTGFGPPDESNAPLGHESGLFRWKPVAPAARSADNPPVLGPAGTVRSTLEDYAKFVAAHLAGAQGSDGLVSAEIFATLHTPDQGDYAKGWIVTERGWAGGRVLTHGGSNTMWFATLWLAPEKDWAFFAVTNAGGNTAYKAVDSTVVALIERHLGLP